MTNRLTNEEIQAEVEAAGLRLVPKDHSTELEILAKRIDGLTLESASSHAAAIATRDGQQKLSEDMKLLLEIRGEVGKAVRRIHDLETTAVPNVSKRVTYLEEAKSAHASTLTEHEAKHVEHTDHITGVFKRLVVIEKIIKPTRALARRKKKTR